MRSSQPSTSEKTDKRWLRLGPAAQLLGVSINTLRRWSDAGRIPCYRSAGGHRRFDRRELEGVLEQQGGGGARRARPAAPHETWSSVSSAALATSNSSSRPGSRTART